MRIANSTISTHSLAHPKPGHAQGKALGHEGRDLRAAPPAEPPKAANVAETSGKKITPPGLERVLERLQSIATDERTHGQGIALDRIARNIQKYIEVRDVVGTPETAPAPSPTEPPVESNPPTDSVASPGVDSVSTGSDAAATEPTPPATT